MQTMLLAVLMNVGDDQSAELIAREVLSWANAVGDSRPIAVVDYAIQAVGDSHRIANDSRLIQSR